MKCNNLFSAAWPSTEKGEWRLQILEPLLTYFLFSFQLCAKNPPNFPANRRSLRLSRGAFQLRAVDLIMICLFIRWNFLSQLNYILLHTCSGTIQCHLVLMLLWVVVVTGSTSRNFPHGCFSIPQPCPLQRNPHRCPTWLLHPVSTSTANSSSIPEATGTT